MYRIAERIVRHRELEEDWDDSDDYDDGERRYQPPPPPPPPPARKPSGRRVKIMVETNDAAFESNATEFVRNRSNDTHTTENSSGIFSLRLLREIYPSFSECESESGSAIYCDADDAGDSDNENENDRDLSLASMIYNKYVPSNNKRINLVSQWEEDKPFDEESQRAMSEGGDDVQNNDCSKASPSVKEYILPPAGGSDILVDVTPRDREPYDIVKKSSRNTTGTEPTTHALPGGDSAAGDSADIDEAVSRSFSSSAAANEDNESRGNRKSLILVCLLIFLLVAGIVVTGVLLAQTMKVGNPPSNQASAATAASSDGTDATAAQEANESATDGTTESTPPDTESIEETIRPSPDAIPTTPGNDEEERPVASTTEPTAEATAEATAQFTPDPTADPTTAPLRTTLAPTTAPRPWNDNVTPAPTNPPTEIRTWSTLVNYMDPIPESFFPLGQCMGDCDRDSDCAEGLVCFQRNPNEPVPFCYGAENDFTRTDYCTFPAVETNPTPAEQEEAIECSSSVSVVPDCYFWTENVLVVEFDNCNPQEQDWIGVFPDGTAFDDESSAKGWVGGDYIDWAFTCGSTGCSGSPTANSFAFPTNGNPAYDLASLRVYLLRNTGGGPPFEILARSEPLAPPKTCE